MIVRIYLRCPGCDTPTILRVGVGVSPGQQQEIDAGCPECASRVRGRLLTTTESAVSVQLDEAMQVAFDPQLQWQTITTHPAFPFWPASEMSPFIEIMVTLDDLSVPYFSTVNTFNNFASGDWRKLERGYRFYLAEDWERFDKAMSRLLGELWNEQPTMLQRHDASHRLLLFAFMPLDPKGSYADLKKEIWDRTRQAPTLADFVKQPEAQSDLKSFQRRIFDQIAHLIEIRQLWTPALPLTWLRRFDREIPEHWRLPVENFAVMRHVYQQNFELSCQALPLLVAIQNAADGRPVEQIRSQDESAPWIPASLSSRANAPRSLNQYKKAPAETKVAFLDRFVRTESAWKKCFDRTLRNAIAHADADADMVSTTGKIRTRRGAEFPYSDLVESVINQTQLLILWLDLAKLLRIYSIVV